MKPVAPTLAMPRSKTIPLYAYFLPIGLTIFLWVTSPNNVSELQALSGLFLLYFPLIDYYKWKYQRRDGLPLFSLIALMYWLYFSFPLFWGDRNSPQWQATEQALSDGAITEAIVMALLGVLAIWLGIHVQVGRRWAPRRILEITGSQKSLNYLRGVLIAGSLASMYPVSPYALGEEGRLIMILIQSVIPAVSFAILFRNYLRGNAAKIDRHLLIAFPCTRLLNGLASGWLGATSSIFVTAGLIYLGERKKIPRLGAALLVVFILFFQAGKTEVRSLYWKGQVEASMTERVSRWWEESSTKWLNAINEPSGEMTRELAYQSLSRLSLLTQAANVIEMTPATVPYQNGKLYSYMAVTVIPRFLWPDKPSINEASEFYKTAYRLVPEDSPRQVSIAVGVLTEGYINFGWLGALLIMFLIGLFFDYFQYTFHSETSGVLLESIGVVLIPSLLLVESQLAQYLGGIIQQIILITFVFLPIIRLKKINTKVGKLQVRAKGQLLENRTRP